MYSLRDAQSIQVGTLEIADEATAHADEVMMLVDIGVKAQPIAQRPKRCNQTQVVQHPQGSIDRVDRHSGHALLHCAKDGISAGVFLRGSELSKDLQTLMRQLDARVSGNRLEVIQPLRNLAFWCFRH